MRPRFASLTPVCVLVALLALALAPVGPLARQTSPEVTPVPRFTTAVDVGGGRQIGLPCLGDGRPTAIRIAGNSGHVVPLAQPEAVIAAITEVIEAVRSPDSWATPAAA